MHSAHTKTPKIHLFGVADVGRVDVGGRNVEEGGSGGAGHGLDDGRLAAAGRAVEQHPGGPLQVQGSVVARVEARPEQGRLEVTLDPVQAPDVGPVGPGHR